MNRTLNNCKIARKKGFSGLHRDSNPWPLRSRCGALPAELKRPINVQWQVGHCHGHVFVLFVLPQFTSFHSVFHSCHRFVVKVLPIDLYHAAAMLSPRRTKSFVFARLNSFSSFSLRNQTKAAEDFQILREDFRSLPNVFRN